MLHEASHYLFAKILFVPVGNFTIIPRFIDEHFVLGSVQIAKTDMFRRFLIGVAPLIVGTLFLVSLVYILLFNNLNTIQFCVASYGVLCVLNTMWLSKNDLEGAWKVVVILALAIGLWYIIH